MGVYIPEYFDVREMVTEAVYKKFGKHAWWFISPRLMMTLDRIREDFGPTTVNNWHTGGNRQYSGLRLPGDPYHSAMSQHSFGRAADCVFSGRKASAVREAILDNP